MHFSTLFTTLTLLTSSFSAPLLTPRDSPFGTWEIEGFMRDCTSWQSCTYLFAINNGATSQVCTVVDNADTAESHAWYNVPCEEDPDYHISWGWDYANDFTVMTVVFVPEQWEAFFGYSHPSDQGPVTYYSDVGPNAVQWTGVSP